MTKHVYYIRCNEEGYTEITITPKKYWDEKQCIADFEEDEATEFFEGLGFYREGDSVFVGESLSQEEMTNLLAVNEMFVYCEDFINFASY